MESNWCRKEISLALTGGLGREGVKVLPLRLGNVAMPATLTDVLYEQVDPTAPATAAERVYASAVAHKGSSPQAVQPTDIRARRRAPQPGASSAPIADTGPVRLVGVVREGIGKPRGDGTAGSALYAVPFRLSRRPTTTWAQHFVNTWDRPPRFTTMHRPGICRISGDVVTLDGVTIEEVKRYHLETLKACLERVNADFAEHERAAAAEADRQQRLEAQHKADLDATLRRLDFDT